MADVSWPHTLATIQVADYTDSDEPNVRRTPFEDGAIAQRRINAEALQVRRFDILVLEADVAAFRTWLREHAHALFDFLDADGVTREARVRGGAGSVQLVRVSGRLWNGRRYRTASIELEGY